MLTNIPFKLSNNVNIIFINHSIQEIKYNKYLVLFFNDYLFYVYYPAN